MKGRVLLFTHDDFVAVEYFHDVLLAARCLFAVEGALADDYSDLWLLAGLVVLHSR